MNLLCSAGKGLCHGFCARNLWNAGRAKELPGSVFPASTPQSPSCMIHHPPSLPSSPCPALPVPPWHSHTSSRQGRARQQEWHLLPNPGIWDLPAFQGAGSWDEQDVPSSPAPVSVPAPSIPGIHSACTCGCLYGGTVYILGSIMSISGYKCDLSVHIHLSHIYPPLASQEWEFFGLFCAAQTFKRKQKEKA